jgi:ESCRT-II complex subunit VPS36
MRLCATSGADDATARLGSGAAPTELALQLHAALAKRAWAAPAPVPLQRSVAAAAGAGGAAPAPGAGAFSASNAGVAGILRRQEAAQRELGQSVDEAFTDLAALMEKAREMLAFAERMRATMQREKGEVSEELEVCHARAARAACTPWLPDSARGAPCQSCMLSLGIASPVTRSVAGALFHQQLALQARVRARACARIPCVRCAR